MVMAMKTTKPVPQIAPTIAIKVHLCSAIQSCSQSRGGINSPMMIGANMKARLQIVLKIALRFMKFRQDV